MRDTRRETWVSRFETRLVETVGQDWPVVFVEKWEANLIGERRFVETRSYGPEKGERPMSKAES